jgi:type VI secretion system protein ImpF
LPLLDRLIDEPLPRDEFMPGADGGLPSPGRLGLAWDVREMARLQREAVRRDLEILLNTRRPATPLPEPSGELGVSLFEYGLPSFRGTGPVSAARLDQFRQEVETAIRRFEPRLSQVRVLLELPDGPMERLRFRIEAQMAGHESVSIPATLGGPSGRFALGEASP